MDRIEYYAKPVIVGGGTHWLPAAVRLELRLLEQHRFANGVLHLAFAVDRG